MFSYMVELPDTVGPVRWLVAEVSGSLAGYGMLRHFPASEPLWVYVTVDPAFERRGIGTRILQRLLASALGIDEVAALVFAASPGGPQFAAMHGFAETYRIRESVLDLAAFDPDQFAAPPGAFARAGVGYVAMSDVDEPSMRRWLHELVEATSVDIPSPDPHVPAPFEQFEHVWFDSPRAHLPTLVVALHEGRPVAFSNITVENGDAGYNNGTGVAREFRGRGLGTAVKVEALRRAKELGVREVRTDNDAENEPMLAINAKLGYRRLPDMIRYVKRLNPSAARS
jgi:RimJ/RimL family protein N-acetyltransferase